LHIELIDLLRCPAPHAESMLVLTAERWDGRRVMEGKLGCPVCREEYAIRDGVAVFAGLRDAAGSPTHPESDARPDAVLRLAAQLDLREPGAVVILLGQYAGLAEGLSDLAQARCIVVNAPGAAGPDGASLFIGDRVPIARGQARAAAVDAANARLMTGIEPALRSGGRVVAPADTPVPRDWEVLARDEHEWVATASGGSVLVPLGRKNP
jgi:uncharacterized protein YbaR (Trm112 family)